MIKSKHKCSCVKGYTLVNGTSCKHVDGGDPYLLIANQHYIKKFSLSKVQSYTIVIKGLRDAVSIDYDYKRGYFYWMDHLPGEIRRASLKGGNKTTAIITGGLPNPADLSIDWVGGNLYFSDHVHSAIYVSKQNGSYRKTLLQDRKSKPMYLACHPKDGWLYFSTVSSSLGKGATISKIGMDGFKKQLVFKGELGYPTGLTIDPVTDYIYWSDLFHKKIVYGKLDGSWKGMLRKAANIGELFSMSLFEDQLFYADWTVQKNTLNSVYRFQPNSKPTILKNSTDKFYGVRVSMSRAFLLTDAFQILINQFCIQTTFFPQTPVFVVVVVIVFGG